MTKAIEFKVDKEGIAHVVFDREGEKINKLSSQVLRDLEKIIDKARDNLKIRVLVFSSAKDGMFIAGADINEIKDIRNPKDAFAKVSQGQSIFNKIEDLPFPTIALINGPCVGGGLEMSLACDYRIATDHKKTQLGLPEVGIGIIPGFGGTQRLPRLVALPQALSIILSGKSIDAKKAYKIGLVDEIFREEFKEKSLQDFIQAITQDANFNKYLIKRNQIRKSKKIFEKILLGKYVIYYLAKKDLMKRTKGQYPAPLAALKVVKKTYGCVCRKRGLRIEAKYFSKVAVGDISKNLIDLFFISNELKKDSGVAKNVKAAEIHKAGIIGAGVMGGGIAWLFSNYNISVRMKDISNQAIALGFKQIYKIYDQLKKIRKYDDNQVNIKIDSVTSSLDYDGFGDMDIVVEAIIEDIKIKQNTLAELEKHVREDTIIASNTSSLPISQIAQALKNPQRFVGMHFFNPVNRMPLVEVIRGDKTSPKTVATIVELSKKMGKTPIVVKDVPGFLVNRILIPYANEAGFLVEEGANIQTVDNLILDFGMPMGPFTLADTVGIDVGYKVMKILENGYGERMKTSNLLEQMYNDKEIRGIKTGQGFFMYDAKGEKTAINPKVTKFIEDNGIKKHHFTREDIVDRCIFIMINEAAKCLEENVVKDAANLDMAMITGTGFPPFRGGLLKYADSVGIKNLVARLKKLQEKYGERFTPSNLLVKMAKNNQSFYDNIRN